MPGDDVPNPLRVLIALRYPGLQQQSRSTANRYVLGRLPEIIAKGISAFRREPENRTVVRLSNIGPAQRHAPVPSEGTVNYTTAPWWRVALAGSGAKYLRAAAHAA